LKEAEQMLTKGKNTSTLYTHSYFKNLHISHRILKYKHNTIHTDGRIPTYDTKYNICIQLVSCSRNSALGVVSRWVSPTAGPNHPDHRWGSPRLLFNGNWGCIPEGNVIGPSLISNPLTISRLRINGAILHSSLCFPGVQRGNFTSLCQTITSDCKNVSNLQKNIQLYEELSNFALLQN
jgi:hypothetical protein